MMKMIKVKIKELVMMMIKMKTITLVMLMKILS